MFKLSSKNKFKQVSAKKFIEKIRGNSVTSSDIIMEIQRNIDKDHLKELIEYQIEYKKKYGEYNFCNPIILCKLNKKYMIVDGQHRFECINELLKRNEKDFNIVISVIKIDKKEEYDEYFIAINKNKPVKIYKNIDDWKLAIKEIEKYLIDNYKPYIKNSENPITPHFNIEKMKNYIDDHNIISRSRLNGEQFINEIEKLNKFYEENASLLKKYIKDVDQIKEKIKNKSEKPLYLMIYRNFEWLEKIVYKVNNEIEYNEMEHPPSNVRVKIPKKLRKDLWNKYYKNSMIGKCYVCETKLEYDTFECGHVIPVFFGGNNEINNMRPVCGSCNKDMGIENLEKYKERLNGRV